jgi:hypothetical protein
VGVVLFLFLDRIASGAEARLVASVLMYGLKPIPFMVTTHSLGFVVSHPIHGKSVKWMGQRGLAAASLFHSRFPNLSSLGASP